MKHTFTLQALIWPLIVMTCACGCKKHSPTNKAQNTDFFESTSAESQRRLQALPQKGSEDMAHLLKPVPLPPQAPSDEFGPELAVDWVVRVKLPQPAKARAITPLFDKSWRNIHGGLTIYGHDVTREKWSYLGAAGGPDTVDELQFAWNYHSPWVPDSRPAATEMYEKRLQAVKSQLEPVTGIVAIEASAPAADAEARGRHLAKLVERLDSELWVRLAAPANQRFKGRDLWDVMLCLGLEWGDMDCFHWLHDGDPVFSVQTSTAPGYFLPEEAAVGRLNVEDLLFTFSVPRTASPEAAFENMLAAAEYARKRLGGTLTNEDGQPLDIEAIRQRINARSAELTQEGFPPGSHAAQRLF